MSVQADIHLRTTVFVVAGLGVGHLITGDDHAALQRHRRATLLAELEGFGGGARGVRLGGQAELQAGGLAEDTLGLGGVLHARQLDHDAVGALALHQRLGHAKLVDAIAHRGEVLLDRIFADAGQGGWRQRDIEHLQLVALAAGQLEIGIGLADQALRLSEGFAVGEAQLEGVVAARHAAVADTLLAQQALHLAFVDFQARIDRLVHVHFQQEVHTTGQVQTQFHRRGADAAQPVGRGGRQVEGHHIVVAEGLAHHILGR